MKAFRRRFMKGHHLTRVILVSLFLIIGTFFLAEAVLAAGPAKAAKPQPPPVPAKDGNASAACLKCHGPFEKLTSASPKFVTQKGEKINPHRYVPHDLKDIPDCVSCHKPHSAAPNAKEIAALPKPGVKTCYECHHKEDFASCKSCHSK
jgi:predicted CXXCH cytochrome family protein